MTDIDDLRRKAETGAQWAFITLLEDANKVLPVTEVESQQLYALGWNSGFGWSDQLDWYHNPSSGPSVWIEDDEKLLVQWLDDLKAIRAAAAKELQKAAGPELYEALDEIKSKISANSWDAANEMMRSVIANEIWHIADAALAKARGETT